MADFESVTMSLPSALLREIDRPLGSWGGLGGRARVRIRRGTIVVVELDPTLGHEHHGIRPCIVVSDPEVSGTQRFPLVCVVPVTSSNINGLLYPSLAPSEDGLRHRSFALIDHLQSIDMLRIQFALGELAQD